MNRYPEVPPPLGDRVPRGGLRVAWDTVQLLIKQIDPSWTEPTGGQRVTLAFRCPTPADVDAKYAELSALGHGHKEPWELSGASATPSSRTLTGTPVDLLAPL